MFFGGDSDFQRLLRESGFDSSDLRGEASTNCTHPAILEFPNLMRRKSIASAIACFLICLYLFILLAIVCDDYLVPSMERLCYTLRLTYDVAGATFLAAATSAPELFVAFVGTFITKGDIGVGTIVGSSVFNVLGIATVCGIFTGVTAKLDWWPITRDTLWYLVSITLLFLVLLDSKVQWWEATIMLSLYFVYLITLIFDRKLQKMCRSLEGERELMDEDPMLREEEPLMTFRQHVCSKPEKGAPCIEVTWWVIKYPAIFILAITTPSVRTIFFFTMFMAVLWISGISYLLAWFLTVVGYNIGIPDSIMGLTVLAVGTSVPEVVSSYIVTRKGYGSMAMCNAIGSNTFDIFICLGLPWLLKAIIESTFVLIHSEGITITVAMLVATIVLLYACFLLTKFTLGKTVGWMSLITYVLFLTCAIAIEIVGENLNHCDLENDAYTDLLHKNF
ncbi:sodium/potassium/calcium exchanger 3 [Drosophila obscura]|uniref:sodium/potassium/calcium exchanger 3 n=1 Tax=Drosophila obscura TaxID=7282 RepID=UPI000BA0EF4F|nr:sodium/potassium/calcium exchanger 3 [Drosophila obscura]